MEKIKNRPITPEEVRKSRITYIPDIVFEAINELIIKHFDGKESIVKQDEILDKICTEETGLTHNMVFDFHFLDIEDIYREQGWEVTYDKPTYCEDYDAYFKFEINERQK